MRKKILTDWESRFQAIVSNTPGLVFQCLLRGDGTLDFPYLSDGCHALLGITQQQLHDAPARLSELLLPEDRASFQDAMKASASSGKSWNWEGRIRVVQWNDIKWINLRCTPRLPVGAEPQWDGIMSNITESKLEQAEIKRSRAQLAELSAHVEKVKEEERTRIAREIHDDLGGNLTAIKMALALLVKRLPPESAKDLSDKAHYVDILVDRTLESIHRIAGDLRPGVLDFGITAAIEWQAREFEKQTGTPCTLSADTQEIELPQEQATALFRIFQEALTNISKHAGASRVKVKLLRAEQHLLLEVADNGKGISAADQGKPHSFGIRGMTERAHALGGEFCLDKAAPPGDGCVVRIRIPLEHALTSTANRQ
ncbi:sensor histidine kinase [Noviherbaspirillum sedimenti]|uniref:PAS domain-containing sensor histidine kinase n=1 Tax=Noviherbaspirillum sedimenti TaxID=2320865 RepID=A0A3A3FYB9_9BURK|nr:sensor histidine kinase [Noviherbaspirillum sedimenti]RJG01147.1 PAS domain-containing sensor histidine kinase [Noviherbaspirillum sedimenti]